MDIDFDPPYKHSEDIINAGRQTVRGGLKDLGTCVELLLSDWNNSIMYFIVLKPYTSTELVIQKTP